MKTLGVYESPAGGNKGHLDYIKNKTSNWANIMKNGHLPSNFAWVAYKLQLWTSLQYGLGTMTNDLEEAGSLLHNEDQEVLNILGIRHNTEHNKRTLRTTTHLQRVWSVQPCNRAANQQSQHANAALSHTYKPGP
jgi:hypothetical protein